MVQNVLFSFCNILLEQAQQATSLTIPHFVELDVLGYVLREVDHISRIPHGCQNQVVTQLKTFVMIYKQTTHFDSKFQLKSI